MRLSTYSNIIAAALAGLLTSHRAHGQAAVDSARSNRDLSSSSSANGDASNGLTPPKLLQAEPTSLPAEELSKWDASVVVLDLSIDADGNVASATVVESVEPSVDEAVVAALLNSRFEPARVNGEAIGVKIKYRYRVAANPQHVVSVDATFDGIVRNRTNGTPLANVRITLDGEAFTTTDGMGKFSFVSVEPGLHGVILSGQSFVPLATEEQIESGTAHSVVYEVEIVEEHVPIEERSDLEIEIRSSKLQKSVTVTSVSAAQGTRVAGTGGDAIKVVENLPGVARSAAGSGQVVVWGASAADTRVYVDGVRIPTLYHQGGFRSVIHSDLVDSVELVPGGYGAAYGRGLGGLITVVRKAPAEDRLHGSTQIDLLDASAALQGPVAKDWQASVAVRRSHLDWVLNRGADVGEALRISHRPASDLGEFFPIPQYYDAQGSIRYRLREKEWLEFGGLLSSDSVAHTVSSTDPAQRKQQTQDLYFDRVFARYTNVAENGAESSVVPWYGVDRSSLVFNFGAVPTSLAIHSRNFGFRSAWRGPISSYLSATLGFDIEAAQVQAQRSGSVTAPPREGDAHIFGQPPSDQINSDNWTAFSGSAAPYVEGDFAFLEQLHVIPGLRLEPFFTSVDRRTPPQGDTPAVGAYIVDFSLQPRLAIRYAPSSRVTYKAAFGRYRQQAAPEDLSTVFGNPLVTSAQANHWLAGVAVRLGEFVSAETTVFYTTSEHLSVRNPALAPQLAQGLLAQGEGRAYGMQLLIRREIAHGLFGWVAYTLLRSERRNGPSDAWRLFDFDQTHVLTALASYDLGKGFELGSRFRYASGYPRTPVVGAYYDLRRDLYDPILGATNSTRIPAFVQVDVRLSKRWSLAGTQLEAYVDVQNVSNRKNYEEIVYSADYSNKRYIQGLPVLPVVGAKWNF